jgi:hypothetical protein
MTDPVYPEPSDRCPICVVPIWAHDGSQGFLHGMRAAAMSSAAAGGCAECRRLTGAYNTDVANGLIVKSRSSASVLAAHQRLRHPDGVR